MTFVALPFALVAVLGWWVLASLGKLDLFGESRPLSAPEQCRSALRKTHRCEGEDTSFQECRYHFRAEGEPDPGVCQSFLSGERRGSAEKSVLAREACPETSPAPWRRVDCAPFAIGAEFTCFRCDEPELERARQLLVAYDANCRRGIVLKSCNQPLLTKEQAP